MSTRKRSPLDTVELAARAKEKPSAEGREMTEKGPTVTTAIVLPQRTYQLLRSAALKRAAAGGRLSVSRVIADLAEKHRAELEK